MWEEGGREGGKGTNVDFATNSKTHTHADRQTHSHNGGERGHIFFIHSDDDSIPFSFLSSSFFSSSTRTHFYFCWCVRLCVCVCEFFYFRLGREGAARSGRVNEAQSTEKEKEKFVLLLLSVVD